MDEYLPHALTPALTGHDIWAVAGQGWAGKKKRELLRLATQAGFDVFVTADAGIEHQQNVPKLALAVVILVVADTRPDTVTSLAPTYSACSMRYRARTEGAGPTDIGSASPAAAFKSGAEAPISFDDHLGADPRAAR